MSDDGEEIQLPPWSFSRVKSFEDCPKKYYHLKVAKDYQEPETSAMAYGTEFHLAAEEYIRDGKPLPGKFSYAQRMLDKLNEMPGEKLCEYEMGLTEDLEPCGFKDDNVWWRGIADLIILDRETKSARVIDYKTGKSAKYADSGQLELMALAMFKHFPELLEVKAGLLFVVSKEFVREKYADFDSGWMWDKWLGKHARLKEAYRTGVWNARPSGLCKQHCLITECPHNGRN